MPLQTQDFTTLVRNQVAAAQAESSSLLDFTAGSVLLSIIEANTSAVALWLQGLILQLLSVTRLATSTGNDVDTFVADFGLTRLPAVAATGTVTFARFVSTAQAVVLFGTQVETADGLQVFTVTVDPTNPNYSSALGGYVITSNTSSIGVPVQANVAGAAGNVTIGALNTLTTPIPFVDTVSNALAFVTGKDAETDAALKLRFVAYISSLSKATAAAIGFAITSVQQGIQYTLTQNYDYNGTLDYGYFYAVVDDGSGNPPDQLISNVNNAIEAFRGFTIRYGVFKPIITTANVVMTITVTSGYQHDPVAVIVATALTNYINTLPLATGLPYSRLFQVAYDASPGVLDVTSVTLNSGTSDLTADNKHVIKAGTVTVN